MCEKKHLQLFIGFWIGLLVGFLAGLICPLILLFVLYRKKRKGTVTPRKTAEAQQNQANKTAENDYQIFTPSARNARKEPLQKPKEAVQIAFESPTLKEEMEIEELDLTAK